MQSRCLGRGLRHFRQGKLSFLDCQLVTSISPLVGPSRQELGADTASVFPAADSFRARLCLFHHYGLPERELAPSYRPGQILFPCTHIPLQPVLESTLPPSDSTHSRRSACRKE